jgi:uncharacterized protein
VYGGIELVHSFEILGEKLVFDSESGALHRVDNMAAAVIDLYSENNGKRPGHDAVNKLASVFGTEVFEVAEEIDVLIDREELYCPIREVTVEQLYPDQPRIKSMCLHLCHDCNLRCKYCFAGTGDFGTGHRSMLSEEVGRKAIDYLIEASGPRKHLDIDFFGGEPLMNWPVVVALTEYCKKRMAETDKIIRLTITTNVTLLDDEKIKFIDENFSNCVLSIDGRREVNDNMRPDAGGHGTHDKIVKNIKKFLDVREDRQYYLRGTYTRHNLDFAEDVLHLADLGDQVSIEPVVAPPGSGYEIREEDIPMIEAEYERLAQLIYERRQQGNGFNFFHFVMDLTKGPCAYKRLKGCGVGMEYCAVTPEGDIYPCHQFVGEEQFKMGNVMDEPITLDSEVQQPFRQLMVPDKPECKKCWARFFCSGGCAANSYHVSGRINGSDPIGCSMQKKRLECALWLKSKQVSDQVSTEKK